MNATIYLNQSKEFHPHGTLWEPADPLSRELLLHTSNPPSSSVTETHLREVVLPLASAHRWSVAWGKNRFDP